MLTFFLIGKEDKNERGQVTFPKSQPLSGRGRAQTQPCSDLGSISPKPYALPLTSWVLWVRLFFLLWCPATSEDGKVWMRLKYVEP